MLLLKILALEAMNGFAVSQRLKQVSGDVLQVSDGSLYPALQRLLKEELVKAEWGTSTTGRRVRIYRLTAAGVKHLEHEVSKLETRLEGITRVLAPGEEFGS